ncbi:hypothetical protein OOK41_02270 [Micromonospora sp. NBC_01655]|uniref:hypothetical protein n=1 Tax=Micromonospora sp. NBC_01655 TaxID=2975983 RepID=UPI002253FFF8|nr:hypothetical protein [Micromonospora sp. NBC_01655]MCX4469150.1 hypothetical protein [Micromonospora sp. NBC_01655]
MARRGWGGSIATAVGVAAGAGAAQLGFGYGLGIISWAGADVGGGASWVASLAWSTWIASTSTIAGAVCAQRLRQRAPAPGVPAPHAPATAEQRLEAIATPDAPAGGGSPDGPDPVGTPARVHPVGTPAWVDRVGTPAWVDPVGTPSPPEPVGTPGVGPGGSSGVAAPTPGRGGSGQGGAGGLGSTALALAGGIGALVTVLLVAVPARVVSVPDVSAPQAVAAAYAGAGVLIGMLVARWALRSPAAAADVVATVGWLWLLAVVAVADGVFSGRGLTTAQLGIWQLSADRPAFWIRDWFYWPGALLALGSALLIGALAARRTARSPERRLGAAASGAAGPLLVALAYLLAVPGLATIGREQVSAHLVAPYAVLAGLAGSMLTAALAQRTAARRAGVPVPLAALPASGAAVPVPRQRSGGTNAEPGPPAAGQAGPVTPDAGTATGSGAGEASTAEETGTAGEASTAGETGTAGTAPAAGTGAGRAVEPGAGDGVPAGGVEVAAERRPPTAPKPRGGRRTR